MLPAVIRKKLFPSWSSGSAFSIGLDRDAIYFVFKASYPEAWNSTKSAYQIADDIQGEIRRLGLAYARLEYGPGSYAEKRNLMVNSYPVTSHSSGSGSSSSDYKPFVSFMINHVPVDHKKLTLQFMPFADNNKNDVARTVTLPNPIYTPVTPLSNPQPMPATQTDGTMEVTLRTLVAQSIKDEKRNLLYQAGDNRLAFIEDKPIPETGPIAADFFPRAAGTPKQPYETIALFSITKSGEGQDEWALGKLTGTYGTGNYEVSIPYSSSIAYPLQTISYFPGDLSVLPGPIRWEVTLVHHSNFGPDEVQTVEIPLPKEGEILRPETEIGLWDTTVTLKAASYKKRAKVVDKTGYSSMETSPEHLSIIYSGSVGTNNPKSARLLGPDIEPFDITQRVMGWRRSDKLNLTTYKMKLVNDLGPASRIDYDKYTTLSLTFQSPRTYPHKFEFVVIPQKAAGPVMVE
jgi:hypothetical protein